ncbi:fungal protein [Schizosaccharomyces japonicus yFS275]|uniref:Fungal protein n=1 Tax=Schizosaccharomyces japonicus (strain yFS275 / FY16936) TaxID=402676 RepID=B6K3Z0_SCHJY|nr:fungal protein [Schizosaccharomyces japonicus yFS275]EEB08197.2 fungal protein [Schizosaccharomyces japonicus yFS275]
MKSMNSNVDAGKTLGAHSGQGAIGEEQPAALKYEKKPSPEVPPTTRDVNKKHNNGIREKDVVSKQNAQTEVTSPAVPAMNSAQNQHSQPSQGSSTVEERLQGFNRATYTGLARGACLGVTAGLGLCYLGNRYSHGFRKLPVSLKSWFVIGSSLCASVIDGEKSGMRYESRQYESLTVTEERPKHIKLSDWLLQKYDEKKWPLILSSWAGSLGLSFYLVNRDPYSTPAQKVVQARMYAQGITVGLLLVSVYLSAVAKSKKPSEKVVYMTDPSDHTKKVRYIVPNGERYPGENQWQILVSQQEQQLRAQNKPLREGQESPQESPESQDNQNAKLAVNEEQQREPNSH